MDEDRVWDLNAPIEDQRKSAQPAWQEPDWGEPEVRERERFPLRVKFMFWLWFFGAALLVRYFFAAPNGGSRAVGPGLAMLVPHAFLVWVILWWRWSWYTDWDEVEEFAVDPFLLGGSGPVASFPRNDGFLLLGAMSGLFSAHFWFLFWVKHPDTDGGIAASAMGRALVDGQHPDPWGLQFLFKDSQSVWVLIAFPLLMIFSLAWRIRLGRRRPLREEVDKFLTP